MNDAKRNKLAVSTAAAVIVFAFAPLAIAGGRQRAVRTSQPPLVGAEYRIAAKPDSPWLESVAVAAGPSSAIVVWTESGPKDQESTVRFARLAADGRPLDTAGQPLFENGHYQRHVAIDAFNNQFLVSWCDITTARKQVVALRLDAAGRALDAAPFVIADDVGQSEPEIGVTCGTADCLVTWGGDGRENAFSVGTVKGLQVSPSGVRTGSVAMPLADNGLGNGIGANPLHYCMVYAEQDKYGQSGPLVAKFLAGNGLITEQSLTSSLQVQFGTTWVAWNGTEWLILLLDLTTSGGLSQEVRFLRVDADGRPLGASNPTLLESAGVPLLCPLRTDVFLYDPQNRRVVWDGKNFLLFTQRSLMPVTRDGVVGARLPADDYFPRSYALSISSSGGGRTLVAYSRDSAVAIRAIDYVP